jgi:hypothetical protein
MIYSLTDYLQQDLENDEYFYKNDLSTFTTWVSDMNDFKRKQQDFPSKNRMKQIKVCWITRI